MTILWFQHFKLATDGNTSVTKCVIVQFYSIVHVKFQALGNLSPKKTTLEHLKMLELTCYIMYKIAKLQTKK